MNIFGRVGGRTVSETVRGLPGRRQQGEEPGGRPLTLSPAVWREAGPHPELPARRACFSPACSGRCVLGGSGTAPWTPLAPLRLSPHSGHRSTSGALSPGRGPSQSLGAGRSHLQAHAVSSAIPPSAPCIVRGYITGSGWASYKKNGTVCGIKLPEGLVECDKLPEPIYTPSTKAEIGDHDENISYERSIEVLEKQFPGRGEEYAAKLRDCTIALYKKCTDYALSRGIIIADTKFEFGLDEDGNVILGDEMLTPDSSRFWPLTGYEPGKSQPSFDKQFVRDWLKANPDSDYNLPQDVIDNTIEKYLEAYKLLTGEEL